MTKLKPVTITITCESPAEAMEIFAKLAANPEPLPQPAPPPSLPEGYDIDTWRRIGKDGLSEDMLKQDAKTQPFIVRFNAPTPQETARHVANILVIRDLVPCLWQCADFADGWITYHTADEAFVYQRETGCAMRISYKPFDPQS